MKKVIAFISLAALLLMVLLPVSVLAIETGKAVVRDGWFPYPGSAEVRDGKYYGYSYDYLMEIAWYTGWKYKFVEADFAACNEMLKKGEVDIVCGL